MVLTSPLPYRRLSSMMMKTSSSSSSQTIPRRAQRERVNHGRFDSKTKNFV
ncbi:hypothetical protein [Geminiviridae sp.]|nr:hypothetical protein [Geminiviridae sp.]